ncbi:MAG: Ig-like domain-containing protein [Campylobacterota bacterium]|nr:Ig-like domain-containing protein [Campylobacterota bacterium]
MLKYLALPLVALLIAGCGSSTTVASKSELPGGYVLFEKSKGNIPYPSDILFAGSTDGTLNIPISEGASAGEAGLTTMLNTLDGFSTTSPITVGISGEMDATTLPGNIHVYEVITQATPETLMIPAVGAVVGELTFGSDYVATFSGGKLAILPTKPLKSHTSYMVVLTTGITNADGQSLIADATTTMLLSSDSLVGADGSMPYFNSDPVSNMESVVSLEGLRQITQIMVAQASGQGIARENISGIWSFTTQSIGNVSNAITQHNAAAQLAVANTAMTTADIGAYGFADIYAGTLNNLPYYLGSDAAALATPFTDANGSLSVSTLPTELSQKNIPALVTLPNASSGMDMPASGWPVVIFQHGITADRSNVLAVADSLALAGYAAVAIDLPLHGITNTQSQLYLSTLERTFDLDVVNNDTGAPTPDGVIDSSGKHYMNLQNLLVARDNLRQSTSDFIALKNSLSAVVGVSLDASRVAFMGHSLGTITSFPFLQTATLESVTLAMPGGGIAQLLSHSESFGQEIRDGLYAAAGIEPDSADYEQFLLIAQTILDDADSINYAISVGAAQNIFSIETIGDETIPNSVATAPLSGTEPLLALIGSSNDIKPTAPGAVPFVKNSVSRFNVGGHKSILLPDEATAEMQGEAASFIGSKATAIVVDNYSIIQ